MTLKRACFYNQNERNSRNLAKKTCKMNNSVLICVPLRIFANLLCKFSGSRMSAFSLAKRYKKHGKWRCEKETTIERTLFNLMQFTKRTKSEQSIIIIKEKN